MSPSPYERTDEDLLEAYYGCDDQAFAEVYRRHFPALVVFIRRAGAGEDRDDLAEETFLRVVRTKTKPQARFNRAGSSFRTWLFTIARNLLQDHWRRQGTQPPIEAESPEEAPAVEQIATVEPGPVAALEDEEFSEVVNECLAGLAEGQREALLLDIRGFKLGEIAQQCGVPYGTAGRRLSTARRRMRDSLIERGCRVVQPDSPLPPGTHIVLRWAQELLVRFDLPRLERGGYRFVPAGIVDPENWTTD